jgi:hypothetical protein
MNNEEQSQDTLPTLETLADMLRSLQQTWQQVFRW